MKRIALYILVTLYSISTFGSHITGGEMIYEYLGPGTAANTKKYRITLRLFRDESTTGAQMPTQVRIGLFDYGTKQQYPSSGSFFSVNRDLLIDVPKVISPCVSNAPPLDYKMGTFPFVVDLPNNPDGYIAVYETCCRINNITNVNSPNTGGGAGGTGSTYTARIPGTNQLSNGNNSSASFPVNVFVVCANISFIWDFGAIDVNGDSLVYSFGNAFLSTVATNSTEVNPGTPSANPPPDYPSVPYINGFSGLVPLGLNTNLNPNTGMISGIAPSAGFYVVCVIAKEYRNGIYIGEHRKDLILRVAPCDVASATLDPDAVTCDGFTQSFFNNNNSPLINTFYWDFGVPNITTDTSTLANPSYTYPDTGVYFIKLIINKGQSCSDSATRRLGIYPGFFPNFASTGVCFTSPIQFNNTSTTQYGVVDSWSWNFGEPSVLNDTSHLPNPQYTYPSPGPKDVQLIVTNSKGCIDTIVKPIILIDKPVVTLPFKDTLICSIDTLQLQSSFSSGNPTWSPNYNILNTNSFTPLVYPKFSTTYIVTANDQGCTQIDSVRVNVKDFVTVNIMPDTSICLTDAFKIRNTSDALSYIWTPALGLSSTTIKEPITTPTVSPQKYVVRANIGKCQSTDSITIISSPYPIANAGVDTSICFGDGVQLNGSVNGATFNWSPLATLTNALTLTPIALPQVTTTYILTTQGAPGCPKPTRDSVVVLVIPKIIPFAGNDTAVVIGQPLQLNATGATNYLWAPSSFLNNAAIANPIATLTNSQTYIVKVSTIQGCFAFDTINITVFKTAPDIFVATIFTPNGDGTNDRLIPFPVGITKYDFFEVFNRWGQRLFKTTKIGQGWDGKFIGKEQALDTYVWQVQGTDFTGKRIFKKGTVVLVR